MKYFWTRYTLKYAEVIVYMLQATEYKLKDYFAWYRSTSNFRTVMRRGTLDRTKKARLLVLALRAVSFVVIAAALVLGYVFITQQQFVLLVIPLMLLVALPYILAFGITIPLHLGRVFIQLPKEREMIARATETLKTHKAKRIAVVGSFGKTTAKEVLKTVLAEGVKVAATPGNMNTPIGISRFVNKLEGDEDVLVFEFGEEKPGDVKQLAEITQPDIAIITGINEAHLSSFGSLEKTVETIFEIEKFVDNEHLYKNQENELVASAPNEGTVWFSGTKAGDWEVSDVDTAITGTTFTMRKADETIAAHTGFIGTHTVGVTAAAAAIAYDLGVMTHQIEAGLSKVVAFEHRMAQRQLHGAWIIDDTYNGNSHGVKAGLEFLKDSGAKRRVYITPGLVEQGDKTQEVHENIGRQIAVSADVVVLMQNSTTPYIQAGLTEAGFKGTVIISDNPLEFYSNLDQFVAAGDIVLMQNDWTDNYR